MTTTKAYDYLNRLTSISSSSSFSSSFNYAYNSANQRTSVTNTDKSRWIYGHDSLGQVTSGKKYWKDGTAVAGQQFEYTFDDIGNRTQTRSGRDANGANLREASYAANSLNQYIRRKAPRQDHCAVAFCNRLWILRVCNTIVGCQRRMRTRDHEI